MGGSDVLRNSRELKCRPSGPERIGLVQGIRQMSAGDPRLEQLKANEALVALVLNQLS